MDLQRILFKMEKNNYELSAKISRFLNEFGFFKRLNIDLRVTLTWATDLTDVDLYIVEPNGEVCYSFCNHSRNGGMMSRDFTEGYGPIEYLLKRAMKGKYLVKVKLFSAANIFLSQDNPIVARVNIYSNIGSENEKEVITSVRLSQTKSLVEIATIRF